MTIYSLDISISSHLTNQDLISNLFDIPGDNIKGETVPEIIDYLISHSDDVDRVMMVKEIAERYGERRLSTNEPFKKSSQVYDHFRIRLGEAKQENFLAILLDQKHRIIREQQISLGSLSRSIVHPREVFAPAIEHRAAAIILVHNHPSGDADPSTQDIEITKRLCEVGELVGIGVVDHVIVGRDCYFSFIDAGMM